MLEEFVVPVEATPQVVSSAAKQLNQSGSVVIVIDNGGA